VARRVQADAARPHSPSLVDLEVASVLRRLVRLGVVDARRGGEAIVDLADFALVRFPHTPLLGRIWELRDRLTAYDAAYVALAEELNAPLLTLDTRLARAGGHRAKIDLVS
jgi:predicted nucleic acid-binding protein